MMNGWSTQADQYKQVAKATLGHRWGLMYSEWLSDKSEWQKWISETRRIQSPPSKFHRQDLFYGPWIHMTLIGLLENVKVRWTENPQSVSNVKIVLTHQWHTVLSHSVNRSIKRMPIIVLGVIGITHWCQHQLNLWCEQSGRFFPKSRFLRFWKLVNSS